jgi:hypothetical protein
MKSELNKTEWRKENKWRTGVAVALFLVIIFTVFSIESNIDATMNLGALAPQNYLHHPALNRSIPPDPSAIADWMTFDYLNKVFKMPPEYLKNAMNILNAKYPRLTVRRFAADNSISPALALTQVKVAVQSFLSSQTK